MSRHVELRNDADPPVGCISDNVANLFLGVVKPVRPHRLQLGEALALNSEPLVIGEMPVEDIHLHRSQTVNVALDDLDRLPMAGDVDHQSPPRKARLVPDADERQKIAMLICRDELQNRFQTANRTHHRIGLQRGVLRSNFE